MATDAKTNRKSSGTSRSPSGSAKAAKTAVEAHGTSLTVPSLGAVQLPSKGTLAYFGAVAGLAAPRLARRRRHRRRAPARAAAWQRASRGVR